MARGASRALSELAASPSKRKTVEEKVADLIKTDPSLSIGTGRESDMVTVRGDGTAGKFAASIEKTNDPNGWSYLKMEGIKGQVKGIYLHKVESDQKGGGNLALRKVIELSEKSNLPIFLTPLPFGAKGKLTEEDLTNWYARNGFKEVPQPWYYTGGKRMVRLPSGYRKTLDDIFVKLPPKMDAGT
jgi:hypothetical protein